MTRELAIRNYRTMYRYMSEHYMEYLDRLREEIRENYDEYTDSFSYLKKIVYNDLTKRGILEVVPFINRSHCYLCAYVGASIGLNDVYGCDDYCPILFKKVFTNLGILNDCTFHCVTIEMFLKLILRTENPSPYLTNALSRFFAKIAKLPERKEKSHEII